MGSLLKVSLAVLLLSTTATSFDPGGLEYYSEDFSLTINNDGSGELAIAYKNFGSKEERSSLRKKDLSNLKDSVMSNSYVEQASSEGVDVSERRLEYEGFTLNAFILAKSRAYGKLFQVFTHYKFEVQDMIYITPLNGIVGQASLSEGGKIVIRNNMYTFSWPTDTKNLTFTAVYKITGASFASELRKR